MSSWGLYSYFYSLSLRNLFPYEHLLEDLSNALDAKEGDSILDAGCGPGMVIERVARANEGKKLSITGLDFSKRMIGQARGRCKNFDVRFFVADLNRRLDFAESSFDKVVCSNTLYALENPHSVISEFHRVLKQGGSLIIANPKPNADQRQLIRAHIAETNKLTPARRKIYHILTSISLIPVHLAVIAINKAIVQRGRKREYHFWDRDELERILREVGFHSVHTGSCYAGQNWLVKAEK